MLNKNVQRQIFFFTLVIQHEAASFTTVLRDERGAVLDRWRRGKPSKGMDIAEVEILTVPVTMLTHTQKRAKTDLCPVYVFQLYLLIMSNRKLRTGKSNNF